MLGQMGRAVERMPRVSGGQPETNRAFRRAGRTLRATDLFYLQAWVDQTVTARAWPPSSLRGTGWKIRDGVSRASHGVTTPICDA